MKSLSSIIIFVFLLILAGCGSDELASPNDRVGGTVIMPSADIVNGNAVPSTRAANGKLQWYKIHSGATFGLFVIGSDGKVIYNNVKYTIGDDGKTLVPATDTKPLFPADGSPVTLIAYTPYNETYTTLGEQTFTVPYSQHSDEAFLNADLLWGKTTNATTDNCRLRFHHKLAIETLQFRTDDNFPLASLEHMQIRLASMYPSVTINLKDGTLGQATGKTTHDILAFWTQRSLTSAADIHAAAVVIPQTIQKDKRFVRMVMSDGTWLSIYSPETYIFESGYYYTSTINLTSQQGVFKGVITDWQAHEDIKGDITQEP